MIVSLSREFGVPLTAEDFGGAFYVSHLVTITITSSDTSPTPLPNRR